MADQRQAPTILSPYRVLDLTTGQVGLCARLLGDLGADVIKLEPPQGDPLRSQRPFYKDIPHRDRSLHYWAYNNNKRGVTLDLTAATGRELFLGLVTTADVVVESFPPDTLGKLGLGYSELTRAKEDMVLTSITPFGQTGPYAQYRVPDLVGQAMGGLMYVTGDQDRRPVRVTFPQAYLHAAAEGSVGTMMALYHKATTGQGQHVDVSMQQAVVWSLMNATTTWDLNRVNVRRAGALRGGGGRLTTRLNWPCKDGFITFTLGGGSVFGPSTQALVGWMAEEQSAPDYLTLTDFPNISISDLSQEELDLMSQDIQQFFLRHTKEDLFEKAAERRIILYPISTMQDLASNRQLAAREFYIAVEHPELGETITYLGIAPRFGQVPNTIWRRPPLLGEHNYQVFCEELGLTHKDLVLLRATGVI